MASEALAKQRKVQVVRGVGEFTGPNTIKVGDTTVGFEHCIIAAGSEAASLPFLPEDERIMDSTGALEIAGHPGAAAGHRRRDHRPRDGDGL